MKQCLFCSFESCWPVESFVHLSVFKSYYTWSLFSDFYCLHSLSHSSLLYELWANKNDLFKIIKYYIDSWARICKYGSWLWVWKAYVKAYSLVLAQIFLKWEYVNSVYKRKSANCSLCKSLYWKLWIVISVFDITFYTYLTRSRCSNLILRRYKYS
jgi:hypothetical protein